jgi:mRNA-degrading endonuclease YafQ of YafQ-DinJ toxin-antitoxin module
MNLVWSPAFSRSVKKMLRQSPQMAKPIAKALGQLSADAYHPSLKTHKLKGDLEGIWSCSIDYYSDLYWTQKQIMKKYS